MYLEDGIPRCYQYGTTITVRITFLNWKVYLIGVVNNEEPWLLLTEAREPIFGSAFVQLNSCNPCNGREGLLGMLVRARINPKDAPEASIYRQLRIVLGLVPGIYLFLLSEANLQQNCVLPDPGRP